jgi:S-adenosyl-L-methionine hydrolase (adenosine-forming)
MAEETYDITLFADGGSRGNPGPAGIGAVILRGNDRETVSEYIGEATNNEAEYQALIAGLKKAAEQPASSIHVKADSLLMVRQLLGHYKIKSPNIRPLHAEAAQLLRAYAKVGIEHIPRESNSEADALVNEALDAATGKTKKPKSKAAASLGSGAVITFLSDFGSRDAWAAIVNSVIQNLNPAARIIDITHEIEPFDVRQGAFVLETAAADIKASVHLAVVDPGVGGGERDLIIQTSRGDYLVGPDNGLLLPAAARLGGVEAAYAIRLSDTTAEPCPTFHARDVFALAAAWLAGGDAPEKIADQIEAGSLTQAPYAFATVVDGEVDAQIIDIDRFGTLRLNLERAVGEASGLVAGVSADVTLGDLSMNLILSLTFSDAPKHGALLVYDSSGYLCVAVNGGSAAELTGAKPGDSVTLRRLNG